MKLEINSWRTCFFADVYKQYSVFFLVFDYGSFTESKRTADIVLKSVTRVYIADKQIRTKKVKIMKQIKEQKLLGTLIYCRLAKTAETCHPSTLLSNKKVGRAFFWSFRSFGWIATVVIIQKKVMKMQFFSFGQ